LKGGVMQIFSGPSLILGSGLIILTFAVILSICKTHLPGIPNMFLEGVGFFLIFLISGQQRMFWTLLIVISASPIAALLDPFIWKLQGYCSKHENKKAESWLINIRVAGISLVAFWAGYAFS